VSGFRILLLASVLTVPGCATHTGTTAPPVAPRAVEELRSDLERVFDAPVIQRGVWAVDVMSMATGEHLYRLNAERWMMPASNLKILTLAAAAETLGWDYRFKTTLEARGPTEAGVLKGDLVVRSNGDPTINGRDGRAAAVFREWTSAVAAAGITSVEGRVIGDDQAFDDEGLGAGWAWDYLQYDYAAPVGALEFNENTATLLVAPGNSPGSSPIVSLSPGSGLTLVNLATTGASGSVDTIDFHRPLDRTVLEVTGSVPIGGAHTQREVAVVNPTVFFVRSLKDALVAAGVPISGEAVDLDDVAAELEVTGDADVHPLASTESPPLRDIATVMMKVSQNLYAETLLKALGAARGGLGTAEGGRIAVHAVLQKWGVPDDGYTMSDGSGLSRYNYLTAGTLITVLERMYKDPRHRDAFAATLAVAGKDGTLASRLERTRARGNVVAKTGSISNVRALSGFVRTRDGEVLAFSILANDFAAASATVNYVTDLAVEILSNFTRH
jgi:D-alanyl-D-alanine carboxypeptidase/D-alanyl-D-alanine-endopeptidase (penicillin-binding protein 4)